jgi:hypothetical protein
MKPHVTPIRASAILLALAALPLTLASCSGGHAALLPGPGGVEASAPASPLAGGLPALDKLPAPVRSVSLSGPGWYGIPLDELAASAGATVEGDAVALAGAATLSYVLYGVFRFDGDNGPTSLKASVTGVSGDYYVAFSDYKHQRWAFAGPFTGSAEASVPDMNNHTSVNDFVSPIGACYVAIIVKPGAALTLTKLELGVHGGLKGPAPPTALSSLNFAPSVRLDWTNSLSSTDPDFAGYFIERAPLLSGDFAPQNGAPAAVDYWIDATTAVDEHYRYRVCAADVSGNRSAWVECEGGGVAGTELGVVAEMRGPHGALYAPAEAGFDFSGSHSLDGGAITEYFLSFQDGPAYSSTDSPVITADLQPGCYLVTGTVTATESVVYFDSTSTKLIVYPRWQDEPVVVRAASAPSAVAESRLASMRGCVLSNGDAVLVGYDATAVSLAVWQGPPTGVPQLTLLPVADVMSIGEPVGLASDSGYAYFPIFTQDSCYLLVVGPGKPYLLKCDLPPAFQATAIVAAPVGDAIWIFINWSWDTSTTASLTWYKLNKAGGTISGGIDFPEEITTFDAVAVPSANAIDIVYSTASSTEYTRLDVASETETAAETLAGNPVEAVDLELDPASGRPVLVYSHDYVHFYRELDSGGSWTAELPLDGTLVNFVPFDIGFDDGVLYAYFATWASGVTARYRYDAGAWTRINEASFSGDDGYQVALLPLPGDPASLVADVDNAGTVFLARMDDTPADEVLWQIPAGDGQGFELHACAGSDGLHAVWRSELEDQLRHYLSTDGGATWQDADPGLSLPLGARGVDLAPDGADGSVWFSFEDGVNSNLYQWDPSVPGFTPILSVPNGGHQRPYLARNCAGSLGMLWEAFDAAAGALSFWTSSGVAQYVPVGTAPVMDGVSCGSPFVYHGEVFPSFIYYGDVTLDGVPSGEQTLGLLQGVTGEVEPLLAPSHPELLYTSALRGRTLAMTAYSDGTYSPAPGEGHPVAFCASYANGGQPLRYELSTADPPLSAELPWDAPAGADARRTVSAATAQGGTGLVLVSSLDGSRMLLQWSDFGAWESLPLPAGLERAFAPELLIGADGRWHILYKDWLTDDLLCWSTL